MALTLSPQDMADLQDDLDLGNAELTLSDARLNRAYDRAEGDLLVTRAFAWRWLEVKAMKLYNTSTGLMAQQRGVIFDRVRMARIEAEKRAGIYNGGLKLANFNLGINEPDAPTEDGDIHQ